MGVNRSRVITWGRGLLTLFEYLNKSFVAVAVTVTVTVTVTGGMFLKGDRDSLGRL